MDKILKEITVPASLENLDTVIGMIEEGLEEADCPLKLIMQITVCVEEVFVNVANYAYSGEAGECFLKLEIETTDEVRKATICVTDSGVPFNPLEKEEPDITLSADERQIGGLGIFMVKKTMDEIFYSYEGGKNTLIMEKSW